MPPFNHFTTKAKEAIRRAHELAIERGQNHVGPFHLLAALLLQEESIVHAMLERLGVDTILLTDSILESIDGPETGQVLAGLEEDQLHHVLGLGIAAEEPAAVAVDVGSPSARP